MKKYRIFSAVVYSLAGETDYTEEEWREVFNGIDN